MSSLRRHSVKPYCSSPSVATDVGPTSPPAACRSTGGSVEAPILRISSRAASTPAFPSIGSRTPSWPVRLRLLKRQTPGSMDPTRIAWCSSEMPQRRATPCWGCGLSLTLRDVRVLRDRLSVTDDWHTAAQQYAAEHDHYYGALRTITSWLRTVLHGLGPEADRIRSHALPRLADGSGPDIVGMGPDCPADEAARVRFLATPM
jgi:hypothetical protein